MKVSPADKNNEIIFGKIQKLKLFELGTQIAYMHSLHFIHLHF